MALADTYAGAVKEFEDLTKKKAETLKNKGKEQGVKKLSVLFKSGKTLEQRIADFDKAFTDSSRAKAADALKHYKAIETALDKLNQGLKKNVAEFTAQSKDIGPSDPDMRAGFEVFLNRLGQIGKHAKMATEQKRVALAELAGKGLGVEDKVKADIKTVYLGLKKGCDETEALMKKFIAKPTRENLKDAFSSGTGPRSISVSVTLWKGRVLKADPSLAGKLKADPEHLLQKIIDLTQRKDPAFWDGKLHFAQPGWEDRAKKIATQCLDQVKNWRIMAEDIKKLAA